MGNLLNLGEKAPCAFLGYLKTNVLGRIFKLGAGMF